MTVFRPEEHPRGGHGQFVDAGRGGGDILARRDRLLAQLEHPSLKQHMAPGQAHHLRVLAFQHPEDFLKIAPDALKNMDSPEQALKRGVEMIKQNEPHLRDRRLKFTTPSASKLVSDTVLAPTPGRHFATMSLPRRRP
jgi:hypothetical protein